MDFKYIKNKMDKIVAGDHMVLLYDEKDINQNIEVISSYIVSRLKKNEKCLFIKGDFSTGLLVKKVKKEIDLDKYIETKQFAILDKEDAYSKSGVFDSKMMIDLIKELSNQAINEGFSALCITGEISWVLEYEDGFNRIMDYEYLLNNEIFSSFPVSAICRYNINKFSNKMIKNIIEVHPLIIYKGNIHENPFYFEVVQSENVDIEKLQVESMLKAIENFTNTKSRFLSELDAKEKQYHELQLNFLKDMVITLVGILELHDVYTKNHSYKVANYSMKIAKALNLNEDIINQVYYAGLVHDIGKTLIPKDVLNKKGKLSDKEYDIVKKHPFNAYKVLIKNKELKHIANIVLSHHERWDGCGYPNNFKGDKILLEARILAIADTYDAMTSDRPYRKAFSKDFAVKEILEKAGTQFDPKITKIAVEKVFCNML